MRVRLAPTPRRIQRRPRGAPLADGNAPRLRRAALVALLIAAFALAGFGGMRLYLSAWFVIGDVRVVGATALDAESVRETAAIAGQRYFTADTAGATQRLLALPRVARVRVTTHFPHAATITLVERSPAGVWRLGAVAYLIAADGTVLDTAPPDTDLPVIDASAAAVDLRIGDRVDADPLQIAARVDEFAAHTLGQRVVRISYDRQAGATVAMEKGTVVRLGDSQDLDFKLAVWQRLLSAVRSADIHELDLRYGDRPFYR